MTEASTRVGFSYGKGLGGLFSHLIMSVTGAPCSHTWLLYYDVDFQTEMVMEAHKEWRLIPFDDFKKKNHIVEIREPINNIDKGLVLGGRLLGSYYDVGGLFGNLLVIVGEWIHRKWKNPFRSSRMVFCSEGVARVMKYAGYHGLDSPSEVRPEHILALLRTDGSKVWPR